MYYSILHRTFVLTDHRTIVTLDAKLGYRNRDDADEDWKFYASSVEERILDCSIENVSKVQS